MLFGGHVRSFEDIDILQDLGFHFGEVILGNSRALDFWRGSGVAGRFDDGFFLLAHGPSEGPPNDTEHLFREYVPQLKQTIETCAAMGITFLTVHLWMDRRFIKAEVIPEKLAALRDVVKYGTLKGVHISLENLSEPAGDLAEVLNGVPGLMLTLDVGHAQLLTKTNRSIGIVAELGRFIRHVHVHDNRGGNKPVDDLHLPIGDGIVDFLSIMTAIVGIGYDGTMTIELKPDELQVSRKRLEAVLAAAAR